MKTFKNILFWTILTILIITICLFSYKIYAKQMGGHKNDKLRDEITNSVANIQMISDSEYNSNVDESKFPSENKNNELSGHSDNSINKDYGQFIPNETKFLSVNFEELKSENPNVVAWLCVPDADINYPVLQTDNNDFYLNHSYDGEYNTAGWIFADFRSTFDHLGRNTVIYGHNLESGSMFGSLKNLNRIPNWFSDKERRYVYLDTPNASYIFQIISVYTTADNKYIKHNLANDEIYQEFLDYLQTQNTLKDIAEDVDITDKILTLSTCQNGRRLSVQAKLVKTKIY